MSGIAGLVRLDGGDVAPAIVARLAEAHPHPVADGVSQWRSGPVGFVRFASNLTPESIGETQPFVHAESGAAMLFDGRLDNRSDLLDSLGAIGRPTDPDGLLVLHAFERWGDAAVHRLIGDYALALWHPRTRRLYCARSPVGWRPFLWSRQGDRFGFATEPRTLIRGAGIDQRLNEAYVGEYLSGRLTHLTDTFWQDVHQLAPGGALALEDGTLRLWRWFEGPFDDLSRATPEEHVERFVAAFDAALIAANRSSGPVASQLSGGLDSSSVVCRSAQLHRDGRLAHLVQPISARFPGQTNDEGYWIEAVERQTGLTSASVTPTLFHPNHAQQWCADTLHLPIRPNALATMASVCTLANARGNRVLLTGEGGDDWFNGSRAHWPDMLRQGRVAALVAEALDQGGGTTPGKLRAMLHHSIQPLISPRFRQRMLFNFVDYALEPPSWISRDWAERLGLRDRWAATPTAPPGLSLAQQQRYAIYALGKRHLTYDPVVSYVAGHGIELRSPFHDLRVTRFAIAAAGVMLQHGAVRKRVLRDAMQGVLPEEVRTRTSKANFSASMVNAVSDRFRQKAPDQLIPVKMGWVDRDQIVGMHEIYRRWTDAGATMPFPDASYGPVWNAFAIDIWLEHAFNF